MSWTDERIEQLKTLWQNGLTASQIAEEMGGVSRNAVIGKAHRLGLKSRPSPVKNPDGANSSEAKRPVKNDSKPKKDVAAKHRTPADKPEIEAEPAKTEQAAAPSETQRRAAATDAQAK